MFYVLGGFSLLPHAIVGAIISLTFSGSSMSAVYDAYYNLIGLRDVFLASPLSALEFRIGVALGTFLPSISTLLAYYVLLFLLASNVSLPMFLLAVLFVTIVTWVVGILLGYIIAKEDLNASSKISLVNKLLTLLPPIYYPSRILPSEIRPIAYLAPTYNISEITKMLLGTEPLNLPHFMTCAVVLAIQSVILILITLKMR